MNRVRKAVLDALQMATGFFDNPSHAKAFFGNNDISFAELDIESLSRFEMTMLIEEELGIELDDDEVVSQGSMNALIAYLEQRVREHEV